MSLFFRTSVLDLNLIYVSENRESELRRRSDWV